jgi:hypothetical protein
MAVFLTTYDLNREVVRPDIVGAIDKFDAWARLSESSYAVWASSADEIYDALKPLTDDNDYLYVIPLKKPYVGFGPLKVNEWLDNHLTY